ncbi:hypothetical protein ASD50_05095 [Mesorhizobium sp. Root552]|nr:hypothetical protein ASD50_05095 [Mesorhizobium sp. Root552]
MRLSFIPDRYIFPGYKTLFAQAKTDLVIVLAFRIVEIPLATRLAPQASDSDFRVAGETSDPACRLVGLPYRRIKPAALVQRDEEIVAFASFSLRMFPLTGKQKPDMAKIRRKVFCQHGDFPFLHPGCMAIRVAALIDVK